MVNVSVGGIGATWRIGQDVEARCLMSKRTDAAVVAQAVALRRQGVSYKEIAATTGLSTDTICRRLQELGLARHNVRRRVARQHRDRGCCATCSFNHDCHCECEGQIDLPEGAHESQLWSNFGDEQAILDYYGF